MDNLKKETRGGAGRNQGRKPKYKEKTTTFSCRVPVSKKKELSDAVKILLKKWLENEG